MDNTQAVTKFIVEEFAPDLDVRDLDPDYDLLDNGIIDSLGLLSVIAWVEDHFGITIDASRIEKDDFRSVTAICRLIDSPQQAALT